MTLLTILDPQLQIISMNYNVIFVYMYNVAISEYDFDKKKIVDKATNNT